MMQQALRGMSHYVPRRCFNISLRGASEVLRCLSEEDGNDLDEHDDADDDDEDDCMGWR